MYRICLDAQPGFLELDKPIKWQSRQVHAEYPMLTGVVAGIADMGLRAALGDVAPNISLVLESGIGSVGKDGSPTGCYASVHNNESDLSVIPVEYPIYDYSKVDPVQVLHEGKLDIVSAYSVEEKFSIVYADLLQSSMKSFDIKLWLLIVMTFFVFSGLLLLRKVCIKMNEDTENQVTLRRAVGLMKETSYALPFETFTHMIGQDCTEFTDRSGNVISLTMTIGFFLILLFYLSLMSTDLVLVTKPHVINNYRDVMDVENGSVGFLAILYDVSEFEQAQPGTIQEEFWEEFHETRYMLDPSGDPYAQGKFFSKILKQKGFGIMSNLYSQIALEMCCKMWDALKAGTNLFGKAYGWIASDPEGKQHTQGLIIRQGLKNDLVIRGRRKFKGFFEGSLFSKTFAESLRLMDFGPMMAATNYTSIRECMSKEIHYNQPKVEAVTVMNFKYLALICVLLGIVSFGVLFGELVHELRTLTRVTPASKLSKHDTRFSRK